MKNTLLSTVAAIAFLMAGPMAGPASAQITNSASNDVTATQDLDSAIDADTVTIDVVGSTSRTGDITGSYSGSGVFTLQGQTGYNESGTNGTNVAVQNPQTFTPSTANNTVTNSVLADQTLSSATTNSTVSVNVTPADVEGISRTGDINVTQDSTGGGALFSMQSQTGMNISGTNGLNFAAQVN